MSYWKCSGENYAFELNYYGEEFKDPIIPGTDKILFKPEPATFRVDTILDFLESSIKVTESSQIDTKVPIPPNIYVGCTMCKKDAIPANGAIQPADFPAEKTAMLEIDGRHTIKLDNIPCTSKEPGLEDCEITADFVTQKLYFSSGYITPPNDLKEKPYILKGRTLVYWGDMPE